MNHFTKMTALAVTLGLCPLLCHAQQNDPDGDGVLNPTAAAPAFGAYVDYTQYPQLTNIPTLYLTCKPGVTLDYVNKTETYYDATIVLVDQHGTIKQRNEDVTFRGRGNATWNSGSTKKPWRLKFPNKTSLLTEYDLATGKEVKNFADAKSWTLLSNHFDKSMIRNAVTYELGKLIGLPFCPAYKFVDLVLNGEYYGTYQISDHMEVAKKRVFVHDKDLDWMIELCDAMYGEDPQFSAGGYHFNVKSPEDDATVAAMQAYMTNVMSTVSAKSGLSDYMDVKSLADYMIGVDVSGNYDGAKGNNYCYRGTEDTDLLKWGPIWDLDLGYGNVGGWASASDIEHKHMWQIQGEWSYMSPFFVNVYKSVEFQKYFYPRWKKLYEAGLVTKLNAKIDEIYKEVKTSAIKNYVDGGHSGEKWSMGVSNMGKTYTDSHNATTVAADYKKSVDEIKTFLTEHIKWLNTEYAKDYQSITGLDPKTAVEPEDEKPTPGPGGTTTTDRLEDKGAIDLWSQKPHCYTFYGSAKSMVEGAKVKMTFEGEDHVDLWLGASYASEWKNRVSYEFELTADDVTKLSQNGYAFSMYVWNNGGTCTSCVIDNGVTEKPTPNPDDKPASSNVFSQEYTTTNFHIPNTFFNKNATSIDILFENTNNFWASLGFGENAWANDIQIPWITVSNYTVSISDAASIAKVAESGIQVNYGNDARTLKVTVTNNMPETPETPGDTPSDDDTDSSDENDKHQQLTNLPTIYLTAETIGSSWTLAGVEVYDASNALGQGTDTWTKEGTITSKEGDVENAVSVQYQGSGKEGSKNSYRLKFAKKIALLSGNKYKQWVLSSNDDDLTMLNNALAKKLGDGLGLPFTPGYQFVDLYVNETYMGTYQLTDRVKAEEGRALVSGGDKEADWHVRINSKGEINENELDRPEYVKGDANMPYVIPKNPDPDDLTAEQLASLTAEMQTYFSTLFTQDAEGHYTAFADNIDKQQLIQWYIAQEVLAIYKGFSSIEAYRSVTETATDQLLHIGILWDNEKALGNNSETHPLEMDDQDVIGSYKGLMIDYADYGVMRRLFTDLWQQAWFAEGVKALWDEKQVTLLTTLQEEATSLAETLTESQHLNASVWTEKSPATTEEYKQAVAKLTSHLGDRFAYLSAKFAQLATLATLDVPTMLKYILDVETEGWEKADLNGDGKVTIEDLIILLNAKSAE